MQVPGGQCLQCRIRKQKQLTWRAILEDRMCSGAEFWTLTYRDAPETGGWKDFSDFLKRYRMTQVRKLGNRLPIRFLGCGEYGEKSGRFHYHALLWNTRPVPEDLLTRLWPHGFVYIGTVTPSSIRYTARYTLKFGTKGKFAVANWSKSPALGDPGMRELVRSLKRHGHQLQGIPSYMSHDGKLWPMDEAMRLSFLSEWTGEPVKSLRARNALRNPIGNFLVQRAEKIERFVEHGDKREDLATGYNAQFWAKVRMHYGKL